MFKKPEQLSYFLAETQQNSSLIVTLIGSLVEKTVPIFFQCLNQISQSPSKWVIVNFRDVPKESDASLISSLRHLKETIIAKHGHLILSGIHPDLRRVLEEEKIASSEEICNNLAEAIQLVPEMQVAA